MLRVIPLVLLAAGCTPKDPVDSAAAVELLAPPPEGEGFQMKMEGHVEAYTETWLCAVYPIPTEGLSPVNWVQYQQNEGTHHMTLSTPGPGLHPLEYGTFPCEEVYANAMDDLIMMFGSQGVGEGEMRLPDGVVANLPSNIDIVHEIHYVNPTDEPVDLFSVVNAWTIPESDVTDGIWGGQVRDENIEIPAGGEHSEWTRCVFNKDVDVQFLASHTHALGVNFTVAHFDGVNTGELFYENDDWHDPKIEQYNPPLSIPAGQGFEYTCTWDNDTGEHVSYGLTSQDEMCNLAIVFTPFDMDAECTVVETSDGVLWP
ncbi:MAG: hypothetical protein H6741_08860 [Alphaproteobacteria bacterium]|nr:hypothetical protein [Alphaproteobacteria bacterium]MCB9792824.1 hypothetical protein [Alphaproteobacteria bacterium]